ncbi:TrlF family AAA-like ATPase [Prauserella endophytica]|uniref:Phosphoesterase n=1 Tax=Prauserella endophytica TaxID=1592324 RepID=A0ABY2S2T0_9PSEU|nr:phosphoesterase [Prauserella endophytica]TKG68338.1 phosphoesterase [Prauserella endophytica]
MIADVDQLPEGSTWFRCALQVNPFTYVQRYGKANTPTLDEETYNNSLVDALLENSISVIGITDHWCIDSGSTLRSLASEAGITVFPGFEATAKDGVHLLVLFDPAANAANINRIIGECGIPADCRDARPGKLDTQEMLAAAESWNAVVIGAHVTSGGGLLVKLTGQSAIQAWTDPRLHAAALGGGTLKQAHSEIINNRSAAYKRDHPIAILRAADINSPDDLRKSGSTCWIKLSSPTVTGLDLAFRTPKTRVRTDDPQVTAHSRFIGMDWTGGFLDGVRVRFNESLNVLIGGRGSGKSTIIESLRYVLGIPPLAKTSKNEHDAMIKNVLGSGTKIQLHVQLRTPAVDNFLVERIVGSPPVVRDSLGTILSSKPSDLLDHADVFGQRELAELARDSELLTELLARYLPKGLDADGETARTRADLERSRTDILRCREGMAILEREISQIPILDERLARFDAAGVGDKLEAQDKAQHEEQLLKRAVDSLGPIDWQGWQVETTYLGDMEATDLPRRPLLQQAQQVLDRYNNAVVAAAQAVESARVQARAELSEVQENWTSETEPIRKELNKVLRQLQPDGVDGSEYLKLRRQLSRLKPKKGKYDQAKEELTDLKAKREELLIQAEEHRAARLRALKSEAKKVGKRLPGTVRATVNDGGDRSALTTLIDNRVRGRLDLVRNAIHTDSLLSPRSLATTIRGGTAGILTRFLGTVTPAQANTLAKADEETLMLIEEVELPISTDIELNVGTKESPAWRGLDHLSTGQKATALLLLLMHRGDGPLIIDQPEDDLDNRFIYDDIVPRIREAKDNRQLLFSTHNANIPVLGDADQIISLITEDGDSGIAGRVVEDGLGSIDHPSVRAMVEELLEGGREAFNTRRYLYGF